MKHRKLWIPVLLLALVAALGWTFRADLKRLAYEGGDRDEWQQPERVIAALTLAPGDHVADIGAGGGYFTFRLARAIGPGGKVYAVDIDPDMVRYLADRAAEEGLQYVEAVFAEPDDPRLPENGVDLIFLCNTYHHLSNRTNYFRRLRRCLRSRPQRAGRIAIVEYAQSGGWFSDHSTDAETILSELEAAGYRLTHRFEFLDRQHFMVFEPGAPGDTVDAAEGK